MGHTKEHKNRGFPKGWQRVNTWSIKGPLLVLAFVFGLLGGAFNWNSAPFAASVAMVIPVFGFRGFWTELKFWITVILLGAAQVPLVIVVQPLIQQRKFPFMFAFGIFDCVVMILAISWVCSEDTRKGI